MRKSTFREIVALTEDCGLFFRLYNPGGTTTNYRLFTSPHNGYFGPDSGIATLRGTKELITFLQGYKAGLTSGCRCQKFDTIGSQSLDMTGF